MAKPVVSRKLANRDADEPIADYRCAADERVTLSFVDALERVFRHISRHPTGSSSRFVAAQSLPRVLSWRLQQFRSVVFYVGTEEYIDVRRLLRGARDTPAWMQEPDDG